MYLCFDLVLRYYIIVHGFYLLCYSILFFFFFFSSRRRHTRFDCDWSSDVCSSDLYRECGPAHRSMRGAPWVRKIVGLQHGADANRKRRAVGSGGRWPAPGSTRSEEHTSELQSQSNLVCRLLLEKKNNTLRDADLVP